MIPLLVVLLSLPGLGLAAALLRVPAVETLMVAPPPRRVLGPGADWSGFA